MSVLIQYCKAAAWQQECSSQVMCKPDLAAHLSSGSRPRKALRSALSLASAYQLLQ
jgi:hypothetical protein